MHPPKSPSGVLLKKHGLWLTVILAVIVPTSLIIYGDLREIQRAFKAFNWRLFIIVIGLVTSGFVFRFLKWEFYLRALSINVPLRTSAIVFFSGLMFVITPGKVGELWKAWFMKDLQGIPASRVSAVVGANRFTDLIALVMLAAVGPVLFQRSISMVVGVIMVLGFGIVLVQWRSGFQRMFKALEQVPFLNKYVNVIDEIYTSTYTLFRLQTFSVAFALSIFAWVFEAIAFWLVLFGFDANVSFLHSVFIYGSGLVIGAISMLPGGLGAVEVSMVGLMVSFGYDKTTSVSAVLIVRAGTLWYAVLLGVIVYTAFLLKNGGDFNS